MILGGIVSTKPEGARLSSGVPAVRLGLDHPIPEDIDAGEDEPRGKTSVLVLLQVANAYLGSLDRGAALLVIGRQLGGGDVFADALIPTVL